VPAKWFTKAEPKSAEKQRVSYTCCAMRTAEAS
jgi:hypothetical protein